MQQLSLREVQLEELNLLKDFDKFCKKYNLKYSLCYGTLIGAARHKGLYLGMMILMFACQDLIMNGY